MSNRLNVNINVNGLIKQVFKTKADFPNGGVTTVTWETERDSTPTVQDVPTLVQTPTAEPIPVKGGHGSL